MAWTDVPKKGNLELVDADDFDFVNADACLHQLARLADTR